MRGQPARISIWSSRCPKPIWCATLPFSRVYRMNALHEQFIAEARELIHQATDDLIAAERDGFSAERIDRVFRAFHTLKGSAGVVDLPAMGLTLHAAEDVLAAIQAGRLVVRRRQ